MDAAQSGMAGEEEQVDDGYSGAVQEVGSGMQDPYYTGGAWQMPGFEEPVLPTWDRSMENPDHVEMLCNFRTQLCMDHQKGQCPKGAGRGRAFKCFSCHFESQRRRCPVDAESDKLLYWDVPCQSWADNMVYCPNGDACPFAHGRDEVSYHPAKYKTRLCNGHDCRGEDVCCFAHSEAEVRGWAPSRYSYTASSSQQGRSGRGATARQGSMTGMAMAGAGMGGMSMGMSMRGMQQPGQQQQQPGRQKNRFCASYPNVNQCRRGAQCGFAHFREEICAPLLSLDEERRLPSAMTDQFFTDKFKTLWCPVGAQHDWQACLYAHTYQDVRRLPSIGYGPQPCPYWSKKDTRLSYVQRCPLGLRCPYSHGAKEQLYHPKYFRTVVCRDMQMKGCPRQWVCAFYHRASEQRAVGTDLVDYSKPLPKSALAKDWVTHFMSPPFFQEMNEGQPMGMYDAPYAAAPMAAVWPVMPQQGGCGCGFPPSYDQWGQGAEAGCYDSMYAQGPAAMTMWGPGAGFCLPAAPYTQQAVAMPDQWGWSTEAGNGDTGGAENSDDGDEDDAAEAG